MPAKQQEKHFFENIILNNRLCGGVNGNSVKFLCIFEGAIFFFFLKKQCNVLQNQRLMRIQAKEEGCLSYVAFNRSMGTWR